MSVVDCPSCGTPSDARNAECARCGRRFSWNGPARASAPERDSGTLFGEEGDAPVPWGTRAAIADRYEQASLAEARSAASTTLVAALVGIVALLFAIKVFAIPGQPEPDPLSADYQVQYARWVSGNTFRFGARTLAGLGCVALSAYALVRGLTSRAVLARHAEGRHATRATIASTLAAIELLALVFGALYFGAF